MYKLKSQSFLSVENTNVVGRINCFLPRIKLGARSSHKTTHFTEENCIAAVVLQFRATTLTVSVMFKSNVENRLIFLVTQPIKCIMYKL